MCCFFLVSQRRIILALAGTLDELTFTTYRRGGTNAIESYRGQPRAATQTPTWKAAQRAEQALLVAYVEAK